MWSFLKAFDRYLLFQHMVLHLSLSLFYCSQRLFNFTQQSLFNFYLFLYGDIHYIRYHIYIIINYSDILSLNYFSAYLFLLYVDVAIKHIISNLSFWRFLFCRVIHWFVYTTWHSQCILITFFIPMLCLYHVSRSANMYFNGIYYYVSL